MCRRGRRLIQTVKKLPTSTTAGWRAANGKTASAARIRSAGKTHLVVFVAANRRAASSTIPHRGVAPDDTAQPGAGDADRGDNRPRPDPRRRGDAAILSASRDQPGHRDFCATGYNGYFRGIRSKTRTKSRTRSGTLRVSPPENARSDPRAFFSVEKGIYSDVQGPPSAMQGALLARVSGSTAAAPAVDRQLQDKAVPHTYLASSRVPDCRARACTARGRCRIAAGCSFRQTMNRGRRRRRRTEP